MGLLRLVAPGTAVALVAMSSACYEPELRDCTIACQGASDCADGQVCGADHFCAGPDVAGHCSTPATRDASVGATGSDGGGGPLVDAAVPPDAPPDAPTRGILTIMISGHGRVVVQNVGACEYEASPCQLSVPLDQDAILTAWPSNDWRFDNWNAGPCNGSDAAACLFKPALAITVSAKFHKD
jgi:hypothetical protein